MNIVFLGAGNVATHLSVAIKGIGHTILQVFSRTEESAANLAEKLSCGYTCDYTNIRKDADIYIVSLSDKVLCDVADKISYINAAALWVHTSGSMPLDTFKCERRGVLYPLQTFSKRRILDVSDVPFFLESNNADDMDRLKEIAESLSKKAYVIDSEKRKYLHLSAVFCCNFVNYCCSMADKILSEHDIPFEVMQPLITETVNKLGELSPFDAQTGPAVRYDTNVIDKHLAMLDNDKEMQKIYKIMSEGIYKCHS